MLPNDTDSALGSALMTLRGFQWVYGARQDPYALLLRAESDDPHELGRRVRDSGTLTWSSAESWVTAHYAVAARLLDDERLGLRQPERTGEAPSWEMPSLDDVLPLDAAMLKLGRAECERLRRLTEAALDDRLRKEIELTVERQAADLPKVFDLMADYAYPAARRVVALMLGVPADRAERFAQLCAGAGPALDATLCPPRLETAKLLLTSIAELRELCDELVAAHHEDGADDLLSQIIRAVDGSPTAATDPTAVAVLLAVAGVDLAATATANTISALLAEPARWAAVVKNPDLSGDALREGLRLAPPVRLQRLVARVDFEIEGCTINAGNQVVVLTEAANRDPAAFTDPDRFDLARPPDPPPLWAYHNLPTGVVAKFVGQHASAAVAALAKHAPTVHATDPGYRRLRSPVTGTPLCRPVAV